MNERWKKKINNFSKHGQFGFDYLAISSKYKYNSFCL